MSWANWEKRLSHFFFPSKKFQIYHVFVQRIEPQYFLGKPFSSSEFPKAYIAKNISFWYLAKHFSRSISPSAYLFSFFLVTSELKAQPSLTLWLRKNSEARNGTDAPEKTDLSTDPGWKTRDSRTTFLKEINPSSGFVIHGLNSPHATLTFVI